MLFNNFCYNLIKWWEVICLDRNSTEKTVKTKKVNDNLNLNISKASSETQNDLWASKTTSHNKINSGNSYPLVQEGMKFYKE